MLETDFVVHRDRIFHHGFHGVEAHALVADLASLSDDLVRECAAQSFAAKLRAQIKALHFADARLKFVQGDAASKLPFVAASRRRPSGGA